MDQKKIFSTSDSDLTPGDTASAATIATAVAVIPKRERPEQP